MMSLRSFESHRALGVALCVSAVLALCTLNGCTNISDDGTRTRTEGTLVGAGVGAALGAAIGAMAGKGKGAAIGAAIGAGVGGLGGYAVGDQVAEKKAAYVRREEALDEQILRVRDLNAQCRAYNAELKAELDSLTKERNQLQARRNNLDGRLREAQNQRRLRDLKTMTEQNVTYLKNEVKNEQQVLSEAQTQGDTVRTQALESELMDLKQQLREMNSYNSKLKTLSAQAR